MKERWLTISNALSASRVLLLIPFFFALMAGTPGGRMTAFALLLLAIVTDYFDGYLARRLHQVSEIGKVIDPIADKLGVAGVALALALTGDVPWWFLAAAVLRDLLILAGGIYIRARKGIIPQSNWPGKIAVTVMAVYLVLSLARIPGGESWTAVALWLSVAFMVYSLGAYVQRLFIGRPPVRTGK